jgi:hypothetical protein
VAFEGNAFEEELKRIVNKKKKLQSDTLQAIFGPEPDSSLIVYYEWRVISYLHGDSSSSWN